MDLTIDFESRSQENIKHGAWKYAAHPSTGVLCLSVKQDDEPSRIWLPPEWRVKLPHVHEVTDDQLVYAVASARTIEGHNVTFECAVWRFIMHGKLGFPDLPFLKLRCSAARASMCSLPRSLGDACKVLGLPIQKDEAGSEIMMKMCKPLPNLKKADKAAGLVRWHEDLQDFEAVCRYCKTDTDAERCLSKALPHLPPTELEVWRIDQKANELGALIDREACEAWMREIEIVEDQMLEEFVGLTNGRVTSPRQVLEVQAYLKSEFGLDLKDLRKDTVQNSLDALIDAESP